VVAPATANPIEEIVPESVRAVWRFLEKEAIAVFVRHVIEGLNLRPRDREILELRLFQGMTDEEIGQRVNRVRETVNRTCRRLIPKVRSGLANYAPVLKLFGEERLMP
jgi:RNA polymerase sigma factor (sigma-70 family)